MPLTVIAEVVPELPPDRLRLREEVEVASAQDDEFLGRRRFPADHQEAARDVIDVVAVLVQRHDAFRVPDQADVIGQPLQMPKRRNRVCHADSLAKIPVSGEVVLAEDKILMAHQRLAWKTSRARLSPGQRLSTRHGLARRTLLNSSPPRPHWETSNSVPEK